MPPKSYTLLAANGSPYQSPIKGQFGCHRGGRGYGTMTCRAALRAIARGGYVAHRVFFADETTAVAAGYRPCAACLPARYAVWKQICRELGIAPLTRSRVRRAPALAAYAAMLSSER